MDNQKNDKPWISNYPPLQEWLNKIEARCAEQIPVGGGRNPISYLEKWITPSGRVFLVEVRAYNRGWDIFTASDSNMINETLTDAESRLAIGPVER